MKEGLLTAVGVLVGLIFGVSAISFLFNILSQTATEISKFSSTASLIVLLIIAAIIIIKIRIVVALIIGAIIGAIFNIILQMNNIDIVSYVMNLF
jgi:hypothetical protein